jgi:hypothetical protein
MKEFESFASQFIKPIKEGVKAGAEEIDAGKMLETLFNPRNAEAVQLVKRLRSLDLLGGVKSVLGRVKGFQDVAERKVGKMEQRSRRIDVKEARMKQIQTRGQEMAARMTPPLSGKEEIASPDFYTGTRLAFIGAIGAGGASIAFGADPKTAQFLAPVAAGAVLPAILSASLMTKAGQRFMLKVLKENSGKLTIAGAGAMGAFLRATVAQSLSESPSSQPMTNQP